MPKKATSNSRPIDKEVLEVYKGVTKKFALVTKLQANVWLTSAAVLFILGLLSAIVYMTNPNSAFRTRTYIAHLDYADGTSKTFAINSKAQLSLNTTQAGAGTTGTQRVGIISAIDGPSPSAVQSVLAGSGDTVQAYYAEVSAGSSPLNIIVGGSVQLNRAIDTSAGDDCLQVMSNWVTSANAIARAQGFNPDSYDKLIYAFTDNSTCGRHGLVAIVPSVGGKTIIVLPGGLHRVQLSHEYAHALGLNHAAKTPCNPTECYGDGLSVLGGSSYHLNNIHKSKAGWLTPQSISTNGTYVLNPVESNTGVRALLVSGLFLEYRQPIGFDAGLAGNPATQGISIRQSVYINTADGPADTLLLTTTAKDQVYSTGNTRIKTCDAGGPTAKVGVTFDGSTPSCTGGTTGGGGGTTPSGTLTASPSNITAGQTVALSWHCTNAQSYKISNSSSTSTQIGATASGTVQVNPSRTTTYTLLCYANLAQQGTASTPATATVTIGSTTTNPSGTLTASAYANGSATLSWSCANSKSYKISNGASKGNIPPPNGTVTVSPTSTTIYTLTCYANINQSGTAVQIAPVTVTVGTAGGSTPVASISADNTSPANGTSTTIHWTCQNVGSSGTDKVTNTKNTDIWHGTRTDSTTISGSHSTGNLSAAVTYTTTCAKGGGASASKQVTVTPGSSGGTTTSCVHDNPKVTITSTGQSTNYKNLYFTLTVKNKDTNCDYSNFTVTPSLPAGWTQSPASFTLNALGSGQTSNSQSFTVTTAGSTSGQSITETAKNTSVLVKPPYQGSSTYTVGQPPVDTGDSYDDPCSGFIAFLNWNCY